MTRSELVTALSPNDCSNNDHWDLAEDLVSRLTDAECELIRIALTSDDDSGTLS